MNDELKTLRAEVERLQKQNAVMREALYAARQVIDTYEPAPMANVEARWKIENALAPDAGSTLLTREEVQPLVEALKNHHANASAGANVFFEQDGKPIEIATDLGEAYQESALCQDTCNALAHARTLGFHS